MAKNLRAFEFWSSGLRRSTWYGSRLTLSFPPPLLLLAVKTYQYLSGTYIFIGWANSFKEAILSKGWTAAHLALLLDPGPLHGFFEF